jgi:hypothetical protein
LTAYLGSHFEGAGLWGQTTDAVKHLPDGSLTAPELLNEWSEVVFGVEDVIELVCLGCVVVRSLIGGTCGLGSCCFCAKSTISPVRIPAIYLTPLVVVRVAVDLQDNLVHGPTLWAPKGIRVTGGERQQLPARGAMFGLSTHIPSRTNVILGIG